MMANSLFNQLGANSGQYAELIKQYQQFRNTFKGDARQQVQQMLNNGQITQAQYNEAVQKANALMQMLNMK